MSDVVPPAVTTPVTPKSSMFSSFDAAAIVSIFSLTLLLGGLAGAIYLKNDSAANLIIGSIIANAGACVQFYVGSSQSAKTKDASIASQLPIQKGPSA